MVDFGVPLVGSGVRCAMIELILWPIKQKSVVEMLKLEQVKMYVFIKKSSCLDQINRSYCGLPRNTRYTKDTKWIRRQGADYDSRQQT